MVETRRVNQTNRLQELHTISLICQILAKKVISFLVLQGRWDSRAQKMSQSSSIFEEKKRSSAGGWGRKRVQACWSKELLFCALNFTQMRRRWEKYHTSFIFFLNILSSPLNLKKNDSQFYLKKRNCFIVESFFFDLSSWSLWHLSTFIEVWNNAPTLCFCLVQ